MSTLKASNNQYQPLSSPGLGMSVGVTSSLRPVAASAVDVSGGGGGGGGGAAGATMTSGGVLGHRTLNPELHTIDVMRHMPASPSDFTIHASMSDLRRTAMLRTMMRKNAPQQQQQQQALPQNGGGGKPFLVQDSSNISSPSPGSSTDTISELHQPNSTSGADHERSQRVPPLRGATASRFCSPIGLPAPVGVGDDGPTRDISTHHVRTSMELGMTTEDNVLFDDAPDGRWVLGFPAPGRRAGEEHCFGPIHLTRGSIHVLSK